MANSFCNKTSKNPSYWPFTSDHMPIIAFDPAPRVLVVMLSAVNTSNRDLFMQKVNQVFGLVKELGCDTSIFIGDKNQLELPIISSSNLGLNFIPRLNLTLDEVSQTYFNWRVKQWSEIMMLYRNNKCIVGWEVCDEPHYNFWGAFNGVEFEKKETDEIKEESNGIKYDPNMYWQQLSIAYAMAKNLGKNNGKEVLTMFNLAANDGKDWLGSNRDYNVALDNLTTLYFPDLWSYDLYAFTGRDVDVENREFNKISTNYDHFYTYLIIFSNRYRTTGIPFWAYGLTKGHVITGRILPTPNLGMLRFEVMNNLAFGAQGIVYYSIGVWIRKDENADGYQSGSIHNSEYTVNAPIYCEPIPEKYQKDPSRIDVKKSEPIFNIVKQVNSEIRALDSIFWGCEVQKIRQKGSYPTSGTARKNFPGPYFESDDLIQSLETDTIGVVISYIKNGPRQYIVLVNHDPFKEQTVTITIKEGHRFHLTYTSPKVNESALRITAPPYQPEEPKPWPDVDPDTRTKTVNMQPGGIAVFQWW